MAEAKHALRLVEQLKVSGLRKTNIPMRDVAGHRVAVCLLSPAIASQCLGVSMRTDAKTNIEILRRTPVTLSSLFIKLRY